MNAKYHLRVPGPRKKTCSQIACGEKHQNRVTNHPNTRTAKYTANILLPDVIAYILE
jgi:hypothetical protein